MSYINNINLHTIKKDYLGNKIQNGKFVEYVSQTKTIAEILKWKLESNIKDDEYSLDIIKNNKFLAQQDDFIVWLGHATFLIQVNGKRIITDPCLTSPIFTKRHTEIPLKIKDILPDYILISHGHFDHLDSSTIKYFNNATALVPLKMKKIIENMNSSIKIQEAGWYQQYSIDEEFNIYFLPALHWHRRTLFDTNEVLWGSFIIETPNKVIYFAGDTGYDTHFKEIGKLFDIDIAILPIGTYAPRWFMKDNHMNPKDAYKAFFDLRAKILIPKHFGTFDISNEPMGEPEEIIRKIMKPEQLKVLTIGKEILL